MMDASSMRKPMMPLLAPARRRKKVAGFNPRLGGSGERIGFHHDPNLLFQLLPCAGTFSTSPIGKILWLGRFLCILQFSRLMGCPVNWLACSWG
jgi:hypothetical protein